MTERPAWLGWLGAAGAVVTVFLALGLLSEGFTPAPTGPANSSFSTTSGGVAAFSELLRRADHPVSALRTPLEQARLDPASTVMVLGANDLSGGEVRNLLRFLGAGGRLVIGGGQPAVVAARLLHSTPRWSRAAPRLYQAQGAAQEVAGVSHVQSAGEGSWLVSSGPLVSSGGGALLLTRAVGSGRLELLADTSPLQNRLLASADNAELGLDLAGPAGRPVAFAEALHGFGLASGLAAVPERWWIALGGLGAAALLWALARGRRLGPAESPAPDPAPARAVYVESLATAIARSRRHEELARLAQAAGIEPPDNLRAQPVPRSGE